MAEVFAAVASGAGLVSLSLQLLESAIKLKKLHDLVKGASSRLASVVAQLEVASLTLRALEQNRLGGGTDAMLLDLCISGCQSTTKEIQSLVVKLEQRINRFKGLGGFYVAFTEDDVSALLTDLQRAVQFTMLAFQMYSSGLHVRHVEQVRSEQIIQRQMLEDLVTSPTRLALTSTQHNTPSSMELIPQSTAGSIDLAKCDPKTSLKRNGRKAKPGFRLRVSFLQSLTSRVWHFAALSSQGEWKLALNVQRIIPRDARIWYLCERGNVRAVQDAFDRGEASLLDCNEYGSTLLIRASSHGNWNLCRYLLTGLGSKVGIDWQNDATRALSFIRFWAHDEETAEAAFRLFINDFGTDVDLDEYPVTYEEDTPLALYLSADAYIVEMLLRSQTLPWASRSLQSRCEWLDYRCWRLERGELKVWLGSDLHNPALTTIQLGSGDTMLHVAARLLASKNLGVVKEASELIGFLLGNGSSPSSTNGQGETPLQLLLLSYLPVCRSSYWALFYWTTHLERWVDAVRSAFQQCPDGLIRLRDYLADESKAWRRAQISLVKLPPSINSTGYLPWSLRLPPERDDLSARLEVKKSALLQVRKLETIPGAWETDRSTPTTIFWYPDESEKSEGEWRLSNEIHLVSTEAVDAQEELDNVTQRHIEFSELIENWQDDAGPIARAMRPRDEKARVRRRSSSAPPLPRLKDSRARSSSKNWLPPYHFCPDQLRMKFCTYRPGLSTIPFDYGIPCSSVRKRFTEDLFAQKGIWVTEGWKSDSFVAEIRQLKIRRSIWEEECNQEWRRKREEQDRLFEEQWGTTELEEELAT